MRLLRLMIVSLILPAATIAGAVAPELRKVVEAPVRILPSGCETFYRAVDACAVDYVESATAWGTVAQEQAQTVLRQHQMQRQMLERVQSTDPKAVERLCRAEEHRQSFRLSLDKIYLTTYNDGGAGRKCRDAYNKAARIYLEIK